MGWLTREGAEDDSWEEKDLLLFLVPLFSPSNYFLGRAQKNEKQTQLLMERPGEWHCYPISKYLNVNNSDPKCTDM